MRAGKTYKCGFPDSSLAKVTDKLNDLKIEEMNCYKNNKYNELYLK